MHFLLFLENLIYFNQLIKQRVILFYFFRINDPYRLAGLLVILIIIYLPAFIDSPPLIYPELHSFIVGEKVGEGNSPYSELVDSVAPFTAWFYGLIDFLFGRGLLGRHLLAFVIIYLQSAFIGIMLIDKKVFTESTYLPSFIFSVLLFFSFDTIALTGELFGSGLLLLALSNLMKVMEFRTQRDETFLSLGFFISLASLFEFSFVVFLPGVCAALLIYTRTSPRNYLLVVFGFFLPHFLMGSIYFLYDQGDVLYRYYYLANLKFSSAYHITRKELFVLGAIPAVYFVISLITLNRESRLTKYQSQLVQIMFLWMFFSLLQIFYSRHLRPQSFITLIPGLAFFITHFLLMIRRKKFAEINLWILFIGVVVTSYLSRYGYLKSVTYNDLVIKSERTDTRIKGKRILVLENEPTYFLNNTLATPYFSWELSKETFEAPDYYENVLKVYEAFKTDPPDVIIDKNGYMKPFIDRIPEIRKNYSFSPPGIYNRTVNN